VCRGGPRAVKQRMRARHHAQPPHVDVARHYARYITKISATSHKRTHRLYSTVCEPPPSFLASVCQDQVHFIFGLSVINLCLQNSVYTNKVDHVVSNCYKDLSLTSLFPCLFLERKSIRAEASCLIQLDSSQDTLDRGPWVALSLSQKTCTRGGNTLMRYGGPTRNQKEMTCRLRRYD